MINTMNWVKTNLRRILIVGAVVVLLLLMMDLNNRVVALNRLTNQRDDMRTEISQYSATATVLYTQIAFATSEAAVDIWARAKAHYILPGDVLVVPLPPPGATPEPVFFPTPTVMPVENYQVWWALIFGE
jgi:cell division protein FtsB